MNNLNDVKIVTFDRNGKPSQKKDGIRFKRLNQEMAISKKFNNGQFDYYLVRQIRDMSEFLGGETYAEHKKKYGRWVVEVSCVSPQMYSKKNRDGALHFGGEVEEMDWDNLSVERQIEMIVYYSGGVPFASTSGNNLAEACNEVSTEARRANFLFGFAMDRPVNRIGADGWDWIKGECRPH